MNDLNLHLKIKPEFWMSMYALISQSDKAVQNSIQSGGLNVDTDLLILAEHGRSISPNHVYAWYNKKRDKMYKYKVPFSVALALCKVIKTQQKTADNSIIYDTLGVRLFDTGVDITHYLN